LVGNRSLFPPWNGSGEKDLRNVSRPARGTALIAMIPACCWRGFCFWQVGRQVINQAFDFGRGAFSDDADNKAAQE
jgi:hypothetical protein